MVYKSYSPFIKKEHTGATYRCQVATDYMHDILKENNNDRVITDSEMDSERKESHSNYFLAGTRKWKSYYY